MFTSCVVKSPSKLAVAYSFQASKKVIFLSFIFLLTPLIIFLIAQSFIPPATSAKAFNAFNCLLRGSFWICSIRKGKPSLIALSVSIRNLSASDSSDINFCWFSASDTPSMFLICELVNTIFCLMVLNNLFFIEFFSFGVTASSANALSCLILCPTANILCLLANIVLAKCGATLFTNNNSSTNFF